MERTTGRRARQMRERRKSRTLMIAFAAVLIVGLLVQGYMVARLTAQKHESRRLATEIRDLSAMSGNLERSVRQYKDDARVRLRAEQLGMEMPTGDQLRVVNLTGLSAAGTAQSAENIGAEDIQ